MTMKRPSDAAEQEVAAMSVKHTMEPGRREAHRLKQMGNKTIEDL